MLYAFLQYLQGEKRYSAHTVAAYKCDLEQLMGFADVTEDALKTLNYKELRGWYAHLLKEGYNARTIHRKIASVRTFYAYLVQQHGLAQNPAERVMRPKSNKRLPVFYKETQLKSLLDADFDTEDYEQTRNHAMVELFYGTGMRLAELVGLTLGNVSLSAQSVKVLGKGNKERIIPLSKLLVTELTQYLAVYRKHFEVLPQQHLFLTRKGKPVYAKLVYLVVRQMLQNQGINGKKSPHVLRHSFATHLLNHGADLNGIKDLLGHNSLRATQIYTHNDVNKLLKTYAQAHPHA